MVERNAPEIDVASGEIEPKERKPTRVAERRLRVIGAESIAPALDIAVSRALRERMPSYDSNAVNRIQAIVKREFRRLLQDNTKSVRGITRSRFMEELQRSRNGILAARERAQEELEELESTALMLRSIQAADVRVLREEGEAFADRHEAQLQLAFMDLFERARSGELTQRRLREELVRTAAELAREQWGRAVALRLEENEREVENFERRIEKLAGSLAKTEEALARLAKLKEGDPGIASIYRTVQGLALDVDHAEMKRALLEQIFEANVVLQGVATA